MDTEPPTAPKGRRRSIMRMTRGSGRDHASIPGRPEVTVSPRASAGLSPSGGSDSAGGDTEPSTSADPTGSPQTRRHTQDSRTSAPTSPARPRTPPGAHGCTPPRHQGSAPATRPPHQQHTPGTTTPTHSTSARPAGNAPQAATPGIRCTRPRLRTNQRPQSARAPSRPFLSQKGAWVSGGRGR